MVLFIFQAYDNQEHMYFIFPVLFHCGYMLGLWKAVITHYGGLLHVKVCISKHNQIYKQDLT